MWLMAGGGIEAIENGGVISSASGGHQQSLAYGVSVKWRKE
jgi:hypothetical protein